MQEIKQPEFIYNGNSKRSGIYQITNKLNGRIYIGSAKEFKERWKSHISSLNSNKHSNKFLQNDWNKSGAENFVFEVLEVVPESTKEERFLVEQKYVDIYFDNGKNCYNFKKKTVQKERTIFSKNPEETSKKLSENAKKMWKDPEIRKKIILKNKGKKRTPEFSKKMSELNKGKKHTPEQRKKNSEGHKGQPAWNKGKKFPQFSGENHPNYGKKMSEEHKEKLRKINTGKPTWNKGKKYSTKPPSEETRKKISQGNLGKKLSIETKQKISMSLKGKFYGKVRIYENIKLFSPDGQIYTQIENLSKFCQIHNVNMKALWNVLNRNRIYRGWYTTQS